MTAALPPPSLGAQTHHWIAAPNRTWDMCAKCGTIRRADGKNKPCKGPVRILPRGPTMQPDIVGHKTLYDEETRSFRHEPLTASEAEALWQSAKDAESKRAADMPTELDAINAMFAAYQRLRELGWREAIYCPKDGTVFDAIEAGSTGIHDCHYTGEWPNGHWWVADAGDLWPSRPVLFRLKPAPKEDAAIATLERLQKESGRG